MGFSPLLDQFGNPVVFNFTLEMVLVEAPGAEGQSAFAGPQRLLQPASILDLLSAAQGLFDSLPDVPPTSGGFWNNNGVLCVVSGENENYFIETPELSQRMLQPACLADAQYILQLLIGLALPTELPAFGGVLWNNGGVVCIS